MSDTDNDKAAVEALLRVRCPPTHMGHTGIQAITYIEGAQAIIAAVRKGDVPGVYCYETDFYDLWQAEEKACDKMRAEVERLRIESNRRAPDPEREAMAKVCEAADGLDKIITGTVIHSVSVRSIDMAKDVVRHKAAVQNALADLERARKGEG